MDNPGDGDPAPLFYDLEPEVEDFAAAVLVGLSSRPKRLPCKFFYDERGSRLFEQICELDEYYPTKTEMGLLDEHMGEISTLIGSRTNLIELGSGASRKIRKILDALPDLVQYTAVDISREFLLQSTSALAASYPHLKVVAICADFTQPFEIPADSPDIRRVAFFPGSTIGNFVPGDAVRLLRQVAVMLGTGGGLLIGADLKKDPDVLHAAYNDSEGVTAAFNLNLLTRINDELEGDFNVHAFDHEAPYLPESGKIEMRLTSTRRQTVTVGNRSFTFEEGEHIHTENSYKFTIGEFQNVCREAGFRSEAVWTDNKNLFSIHYLVVNEIPA